MQYARHGKSKHGNLRVEVLAVFRYHLVAAVHGAHRRRDRGAAGVFKALAGTQQRLFANHAQAFDFLRDIIGIGDHPVAGDQLCCFSAVISYGNGVSEDITVRSGVALPLDGTVFALTDGLWFWSALIAATFWTLVQRHGEPHRL